MARYIDADALIERLKSDYCEGCNNNDGIRCRSCDVDFVFDMVDDAPEADVVEVVRCKDCKYRETRICAITGNEMLSCNYSGFAVKPTHYCSYGERRKENE